MKWKHPSPRSIKPVLNNLYIDDIKIENYFQGLTQLIIEVINCILKIRIKMCILTTIKHITRTLFNMSLHNVWKRKNNIWVPTISKILFSNTTKERTTTKLPTGYIWKNSMCSTCFLLLKLNLFFFSLFLFFMKK